MDDMADVPALEGGAPVRATFLPFGEPSITEAEIDEVVATLRSRWIGTGEKSARFETEFAQYVGAQHAVAVSSCTAALHLSYLATGCGPGDEVVVPSLTFAATANAVVHTGATPVLCDVDPATFNATAEHVEAAMTERTKAIVVVHFGGQPCDLDAIYELAARRGVAVIEDCAHAVGAEYRGRMIGSFDGFSCFSFYANKNLTTAEGGMVTTPNAEAARDLAVWRLHGLDRDAWKRFHTREVMISTCVYPGFKYNLTDLAASLGLHQLKRLPTMLERRERFAAQLDSLIDSLDGVTQQVRVGDRAEGRHGLHLYAVTIDPAAFRVDRNHLIAALRAENIGGAIHYEPVHRQPYYAERLGITDSALPHSSRIGSTVMSIPAQDSMTDADFEDVLFATDRVLRYYRS
jgi:dTDP-4-amino-4,6-dideoxygalactose transaminase